jgi:hypothetical protein
MKKKRFAPAPICQFRDDTEVNFFRGKDGKYYLVEGPIPESMNYLLPEPLGSATIESIDLETNTIWFKSAIPSEVKA